MDNVEPLVFAFVGFSAIASTTWFFSLRPRLFIKVFVSREDYRNAIRSFVRDPNFCKGMRIMAGLQFFVGALMGMAAIWLWRASRSTIQ